MPRCQEKIQENFSRLQDKARLSRGKLTRQMLLLGMAKHIEALAKRNLAGKVSIAGASSSGVLSSRFDKEGKVPRADVPHQDHLVPVSTAAAIDIETGRSGARV